MQTLKCVYLKWGKGREAERQKSDSEDDTGTLSILEFR